MERYGIVAALLTFLYRNGTLDRGLNTQHECVCLQRPVELRALQRFFSVFKNVTSYFYSTLFHFYFYNKHTLSAIINKKRIKYQNKEVTRYFTLPLWGRIKDIFSHLHISIAERTSDEEIRFGNTIGHYRDDLSLDCTIKKVEKAHGEFRGTPHIFPVFLESRSTKLLVKPSETV